jgi:hypothetical protein
MRTAVIGCLALVLAGCVHARGMTWDVKSIRAGAGAPPKVPTCPVRQELISPAEAQRRYRLVGVVCHVGGWDAPPGLLFSSTSSGSSWAGLDTPPAKSVPGDWTPFKEPVTLLDDVREDTCRLGGEIIVRHGFCNIPLAAGRFHQGSGVEFGVYEQNAPPVALQ